LFNPLQGNSFRLVAKRGANGQINYDSSEVINEVTSIYDSVEAALEDIKSNSHKLSDLLKPESFMTYEQLQDKMRWVTFSDVEQVTAQAVQQPLTAEAATPAPQVAEVQPAPSAVQPQVAQVAQPAPQPAPAPAASNSLDDLLNGLV